MKRYIFLILIILQLLLIFSFSSENGKRSSGRSRKLVNTIVNVYKKVAGVDLDNKEIIKKIEYPIRKCAHFTLYFVLGVVVIEFFLTFDLNHPYIISIIFSYISACLDEFHQTFVPMRTGKITDTFVDAIGFIISIFIIYLIGKKEKRHTN